MGKKREMMNIFRGHWYFLNDGAPCHRPCTVQNYIKRWITPNIQPHPAQSPDLNPIELMWVIMKRKVEDAQPNNKKRLGDIIQEAWNSIDQEQIQRIILDLPEKKITQNQGDLT